MLCKRLWRVRMIDPLIDFEVICTSTRVNTGLNEFALLNLPILAKITIEELIEHLLLLLVAAEVRTLKVVRDLCFRLLQLVGIVSSKISRLSLGFDDLDPLHFFHHVMEVFDSESHHRLKLLVRVKKSKRFFLD